MPGWRGASSAVKTRYFLQLLALSFDALDEVSGWLRLHLSGGADLRLQVEALDVSLRDVTRPYLAPTGKKPSHDLPD